jgi:hypothetical protein
MFDQITVNRPQVIPMRIIARSMLFAAGLLFAAVAANAQGYYPGYYYPYYTTYPYYNTYPGYVTYPRDTYPYPYYYNHVYPWYATAPYYSAPTAYNDPYVASRPYSDGAGPRVSDHVGY